MDLVLVLGDQRGIGLQLLLLVLGDQRGIDLQVLVLCGQRGIGLQLLFLVLGDQRGIGLQLLLLILGDQRGMDLVLVLGDQRSIGLQVLLLVLGDQRGISLQVLLLSFPFGGDRTELETRLGYLGASRIDGLCRFRSLASFRLMASQDLFRSIVVPRLSVFRRGGGGEGEVNILVLLVGCNSWVDILISAVVPVLVLSLRAMLSLAPELFVVGVLEGSIRSS
ncbi:hypothetical protein BZA05DRAFT_55760 [Tricharina praecox]|uniref:uncharacterized protein n=1 Tax=Tricharina praecox TaxID=43433 RepID=UPI00221F5FDC|nr:uncharacterized protein BZA05DRAFT_55760 [Tricharina praecox]KAI5850981.1 hypothetical protein BZA05DRAFT_55760 [Tricharina praecox]